MSKAVVVVESPAKARTIEGYLGKGFTVLASYGHIRDLPSKDGSVDPDNDFAMNYVVESDSEKNVKAILKELKDADSLYLATDPDREGEAISWHVWEEIKKRDSKLAMRLDVHRIEFDEITKSAIQHAIAHPRELALNLINAQQARRALDYLVGFNLSPVLWRKVKGGLSAGRVQSVALRMICERENEIEAFKAEEYWTLHGLFTTASGKPLGSNLVQYNGAKIEKFSFRDEASASAAQSALAKQAFAVTDLDKSEKRRYPAPPFITSTLQQEAARKLGFAARRTMMAAQRLYENGAITYMRTDSVSLAAEAVAKIRSQIGKQFGSEYVPGQPLAYKSKSKNAQEAHEAIRPTDPTKMRAGADDDQERLYQLIWQRTMACQMTPARLEQTTITLGESSGKNIFRATGSVILFPGFLAAYQEGKDDDATDDDGEALLPAVANGEKMATREVKADQHFTEPPPRYSEASLVKALEEYDIGRPSTYASIISTIQDRGYVRLDKKRFFPEDVGRIVNKFLTQHFTQYVDYNFTAKMENELDEIASGDKDWKPTLRSFWKPFKTSVDEAMQNVKKSDVTTEKTGEMCPECGKHELVMRLGRYGRFKGCSGYPECKYIEKSATGGGSPGVGLGIQCPSCKQGELTQRTSRMGKIFYGCNKYPDCTYVVWDKPLAQPCPTCAFPIQLTKTSKKFGEWHMCADRDKCSWNDNADAAAMAAAFRARFAKVREGKAKAKAARTAKTTRGKKKG